MTTKKIVVADKKQIQEIEKGTVLKRFNDLFMVVEVVRERVEDPIHDALFLSNPPKPYLRGRRVEGKYALVSLTTGANYFQSQDSLSELLRKIADTAKFEIVDGIEIKEI